MSEETSLKGKELGLWTLVALSMGSIYPLAFAVSNGAGAVVYAGFAAPLGDVYKRQQVVIMVPLRKDLDQQRVNTLP